MFGLASCSNDDIITPGSGEGMSFEISIPSDFDTRSFSDGTTATQLQIAVFDASGKKLLMSNVQGDGNAYNSEIVAPDLVAGKTSVTLPLARNQQYKIAFWAASPTAPSTFTPSSASVQVSYASAAVNDENRDAFFAADLFAADGSIHPVTLKRPFAQVNVGTNDVDAAKTAGLTVSSAGLTFSSLSTHFQLFTGNTYGIAKNVTFTAQAPQSAETFPIDGNSYLAMAYVLTPATSIKASSIIDNITLSVNGNNSFNTFSNVPVMGNYRTNIFGALLTTKEKFNVTVDESYIGDLNKEQLPWNEVAAELPTPTEENVILINTPEELAAVAKSVNAKDGKTDGKIIRLNADLDLKNRLWTPIGSYDNGAMLQAEFDGNGHTISNLYVEAPESAGLIGYSWRSTHDLTIDGAEIYSHHWAGVVFGATTDHANGGFYNLTVRNASVTVTPEFTGGKWDNGDKAGVIAGYVAAQNAGIEMTNCKVENCTVTAFRDAGGIGGMLQLPVKNCSVTNTTVTLNGAIDADSGDANIPSTISAIIGRAPNASNSGNTASGVTIAYTNFAKPFANNTLPVSSNVMSYAVEGCTLPALTLSIPANASVKLSGNTITGAGTPVTGNSRFGLFVNPTGAGYTLTLLDNDFQASKSHSIYIQGGNRDAAAITLSGNKFANWGQKENADDATAKSCCFKIYKVPNFTGANLNPTIAELPTLGQNLYNAFMADNTWTLPAGAAFGVIQINESMFK